MLFILLRMCLRLIYWEYATVLAVPTSDDGRSKRESETQKSGTYGGESVNAERLRDSRKGFVAGHAERGPHLQVQTPFHDSFVRSFLRYVPKAPFLSHGLSIHTRSDPTMINDLPNELVLNVLSHAPIKTVHSLRLICHQMNDLIKAQETSIYHNAAIFHGFVPANLPYDKIYSSRSLVGVDGWKSFCALPFLARVRLI